MELRSLPCTTTKQGPTLFTEQLRPTADYRAIVERPDCHCGDDLVLITATFLFIRFVRQIDLVYLKRKRDGQKIT